MHLNGTWEIPGGRGADAKCPVLSLKFSTQLYSCSACTKLVPVCHPHIYMESWLGTVRLYTLGLSVHLKASLQPEDELKLLSLFYNITTLLSPMKESQQIATGHGTQKGTWRLHSSHSNFFFLPANFRKHFPAISQHAHCGNINSSVSQRLSEICSYPELKSYLGTKGEGNRPTRLSPDSATM